MKRTKLRVKGHSEMSEIKQEIQDELNTLVKLRDGGCILRHWPETGSCGSRPTKDGHLIQQAEHLHTRANGASYADSRLVVCLCERHHIFYKPQYSDRYYEIVRQIIGPERSALLDRVKADRSPHKMDWRLELLGLKNEVKKLQKLSPPLN